MANNRKARRAAAKNPVAAPDTPPPPIVPSDARSWIRLGLIAAVSVGLLAWFYGAITTPAASPATGGLPGQVWSEEHGHWHDPADEE